MMIARSSRTLVALVLATFFVRATERSGDTAFVKLNFERAVSPYTKSLSAGLPVPDEPFPRLNTRDDWAPKD